MHSHVRVLESLHSAARRSRGTGSHTTQGQACPVPYVSRLTRLMAAQVAAAAGMLSVSAAQRAADSSVREREPRVALSLYFCASCIYLFPLEFESS